MKHTTEQVIKKIATNVSLLTIITFLLIANNANAQVDPSWTINGNSNITTGHYLGTTNLEPLVFETNETEWMRISPTGNVGIFTTTPAYKLDVVGDINLTGALRISTVAGIAGQVLTSSAGGANTWTTPTTGTVTSVTGTAPIISSGGNAPAISITQAGTSANGFLSTTDWNTFNYKVAGTGTLNYLPKWTPNGSTLGNSLIFDNGTNIGIGTTTPGAKVEVAGQVKITGGSPGAGKVLTSDAVGLSTWTTPTTGTVTSVTGTAPIISSGGATPDISITPAGMSANGFLSSTDWNTFNNKVAGTGTLNYLPKWTPNGSTLGNSSIFDNGNVGIGTTSPQANLEIKNGNVLFDGTTGNAPVSGAGTRMMWIPEKAAFRAGVVTGSAWNNGNIGTFSVAFGFNTTAKPYASFVIGRYNKSLITYSTTSWILTEPLFVIGNGDQYFPSNAMTVLKNGNVGITTINPKNKLDVQGGIAIGNGYAGIKVAPANGAIIKGKVGIGTATPVNQLDVKGGISIGATYAGIKVAPVNGAIIEGNVGIGTDLASNVDNYKLAVKGNIRAYKVVVDVGWPDFVFEKNYKLFPLEEIEKYIKQNGHLPEIPNAKEIETNGGDLGELVKLQMQKIEELTLYIIEQNKRIETLEKKSK